MVVGQDDVVQVFPISIPAGGQAETTDFPGTLHVSGAFEEGRNIVALPPPEPEQIEAADRQALQKADGIEPGPYRVGFVRPVGDPNLSLRQSVKQVLLPDGREAWTLAIRSPEALGLRVHFEEFDIGDGDMFVYAWDVDGTPIVRGPFTGRGPNGDGDFWTASLPGEIAHVEITNADLISLSGVVAGVLHFDRPPGNPDYEGGGVGRLFPCHEDVMCYTDPPVSVNARNAGAQMNYVDGGVGFLCSGTLLEDLDSDTIMPYFITAEHCINNQTVTNTLEAVYLYQRASCGGALPNYFTLPRSNGGTWLVSNPASTGNDMTFIRLNGFVPGGVALAGWSSAAIPGGTDLVGIHHPGGSWKRVTFMHTQTIIVCWPTSRFHYLVQDNGIIEGGSSGSGLFNDMGQLVGELTGICYPASITPACGNLDEYNAVYGRFSVTYPLISRWLEIGGTIHADAAYAGTELGTPTQPYNTIGEAHSFAWNGSRIKAKGGNYTGPVTLNKQVTLLSHVGVATIGQ